MFRTQFLLEQPGAQVNEMSYMMTNHVIQRDAQPTIEAFGGLERRDDSFSDQVRHMIFEIRELETVRLPPMSENTLP